MTMPTSEEQYLLELINEARLDPQSGMARYLADVSTLSATHANIQDALNYFGVSAASLNTALASLSAVGPLAWNSSLGTAAEKHSAAMIAADEQSHQVAGEDGLGTRVKAEGYNYSAVGENVYAFAPDLLTGQAAFLIDWGYDAADYNGSTLRSNYKTIGDGLQDDAGHRANIMSAVYREIGIDVTSEYDASTDVGNLVITQDLGASGKVYITGVAYTDKDGDDFYSLGEGRGDLTVKIGSSSVTSYDSGGYSLAASKGANSVVFTGGGLPGAVTVNVEIDTDNIKLDIVDGKILQTSESIQVSGAIAEIRALGSKGLTIEAGSGAQKITGTAANDVLSGGDGNDTLIGGLGDDVLNGGGGTDMAIFSGNHLTYTIGTAKDGSILMSSTASGTDIVTGIEVFRFSNGDFKLVDGLLTRTGSTNTGGNTDGYNVITGTSAADVLNGTAAADLFLGKLGNDTIHGAGGMDIASYPGHLNSYTVASRGSSIIIIGADSGTDTVDGVEIFRFSNGDFVMGTDGILTPYTGEGEVNHAPQAAASQNLSTFQGTPLTVKVIAYDADGDLLNYSAQNPSHGTVTNQGDGKFVYTPTSSFSGYDSFKVIVKDGNGGTMTQTVNIGVEADAAANAAPEVLSTQLATTTEDTAVSITIQASDPDGDTLTFVAGSSDHGSITGGSAGVFTYTPTNGFQGFDSFDVTVSDGKGGTATLTVTVQVEADTGGGTPINHAPVANAIQTAVVDDLGKVTITVAATDEDGDKLTWKAGTSSHGVITGGTNGVFTYVAKPGFDGLDTFTVTVTDGKGGSATQEITIVDTLPNYLLLASSGFKGTIGGNGAVFGTQAFQDIKLLDVWGETQFDASFNKGGDIVRLPKAAGSYSVSLDGSAVVLNDGDSSYVIPVGGNGLALVFTDGVRNLRYDSGADAVKIGNQTVTEAPVHVTAPSDGTPLPTGANSNAQGLIALDDGSDITLGGHYSIFGTAGHEEVHYLSGNMTLDPSFNRGGDILYMPRGESSYSAYVIGTSLVLTSVDGQVTIPVGVKGMTISFAGEEHVLKIDPGASAIVIGDQEITGTNANTATHLGDGSGGGDISLDAYNASIVTHIDLNDGQSYLITDNATINTNVEISGMDMDDKIEVSGASTYSFTSMTADGDNQANDLMISYNEGGKFAQILITDVLTTGTFVYNEATAEIAAGWDLISFG